MAMIGKVRRMYHRQKKSVREISRITSLSRNTIDKWLQAPLKGEPKYVRESKPGKLTAFHEALQQALNSDGHRPKKERRTALALYGEIKATGLRVANSQYDGIRLCGAVLRVLTILVAPTPCASFSSSPSTCWSPSRSCSAQVAYAPSPQSLFCSNIRF